MIKLHFCRSQNIGGYAIQAATFSRWNHVAIEVGGLIYDATLSHGVKRWPPGSMHQNYDEVQTIELSVPNELAVIRFLDAQVGKRYDWTALVALPFRADWHRENKWFCSELAAAALQAGGVKWLYVALPDHRVTPRDLWVFSWAVKGALS